MSARTGPDQPQAVSKDLAQFERDADAAKELRMRDEAEAEREAGS